MVSSQLMKSSNNYYQISACRYCKSDRLVKFLSLGMQPLADSFIKAELISKEVKYPLDLMLCKNCFLTQLGVVVAAEVIFDDYFYLSSSSKALKTHYHELAKYLVKRFEIRK